MSVKLKIIVYSLTVIIIGAIGIIFYAEPSFIFTDTTHKDVKTVIIDAGHGGFDGGAVVGDVLEKDINLEIANRLSVMLKASGFNVICTRNDDSSTESDPTASVSARKRSDLNNRLKIIKEYPDGIFVSIHLNKFSSTSVKGAQMFYSPKNENSKRLAECLKTSVTEFTQPDNKRTVKEATSSIFLLYYSPIPSVIAECGFMSNAEELGKLQDKEYQSKMAYSIFCGILNYYNN